MKKISVKSRRKISHRSLLTDEILEGDIGNRATASVALDKHHLVRVPGVHVSEGDRADVSILAEGSHTAATAPVAVDVFDQDVLGGTLQRLLDSSLTAEISS